MMTHGIEPSFGNVVFMIFVLSLWYAFLCQLVSLTFACVNIFAIFLVVVTANDLSLPVFIAISSLLGPEALLRMNSLRSFAICTA